MTSPATILDFFPENGLGDGPKNSGIRVKFAFFNLFEILSVILILIIRHRPHPELKVGLFVEFAIQTLASIPEVIYCERTDIKEL